MYTLAMRLLKRPPIAALIALLVCSAGMVLFAWNGAAGNPRDGWSVVKASLGASPMPDSGSRAYFIAGPSLANTVRYEINGNQSSGTVMVRRDRRGLFFPWLQTIDVKLIQYQPHMTWKSGTGDPNFHDTLVTVRSAYVEYAQQRGEWYQRVVDAIDAELGGAYPARTVHWRLAMLDALSLISPFVLVYSLTWLIVRLTQVRTRTRVDGPVLYEPAE